MSSINPTQITTKSCHWIDLCPQETGDMTEWTMREAGGQGGLVGRSEKLENPIFIEWFKKKFIGLFLKS